MKYRIIWWWNTLCYKNNRGRLTKANVDSSFKNSCPKSCLDHWSWIFKPLKLQERARTHILHQKGTILTKTREWLLWDWNRGHSFYPSVITSLLDPRMTTVLTRVALTKWLWTWADIRSPAGNKGTLPKTGGFLRDSEQMLLTQCYLPLCVSCSTNKITLNPGLQMTERSEDQGGRRTGSDACWPELLVSQEQSPALGKVTKWLCAPEGGTQATVTGHQQLLKKAYVDGN